MLASPAVDGIVGVINKGGESHKLWGGVNKQTPYNNNASRQLRRHAAGNSTDGKRLSLPLDSAYSSSPSWVLRVENFNKPEGKNMVSIRIWFLSDCTMPITDQNHCLKLFSIATNHQASYDIACTIHLYQALLVEYFTKPKNGKVR